MNVIVYQYTIRHAALCLACFFPACLFAQPAPTAQDNLPAAGDANRAIQSGMSPAAEVQLPKRIFGIIPNYRSNPNFRTAHPLTATEKFRLAARDSYDPGTFLLTGIFAGIGQISNGTPSYGHGAAGYGRYYGSTYGDFTIGNFLSEAAFPSLLHQDPRYFRRGTGSTWSRLGYAISQIFLTHGDNRKSQFNTSEFAGTATAIAISNTYNPDNRTAPDAAAKFGIQLGVDMAGNVLKEFAPDLSRMLPGRKRPSAHAGQP